MKNVEEKYIDMQKSVNTKHQCVVVYSRQCRCLSMNDTNSSICSNLSLWFSNLFKKTQQSFGKTLRRLHGSGRRSKFSACNSRLFCSPFLHPVRCLHLPGMSMVNNWGLLMMNKLMHDSNLFYGLGNGPKEWWKWYLEDRFPLRFLIFFW